MNACENQTRYLIPFIPGQECPLFKKKKNTFSKIEWMFPPRHSISLTLKKRLKFVKNDAQNRYSFHSVLFRKLLGENIRVIKCFIMSYKAFQLDAGKVHSFQRKKNTFPFTGGFFWSYAKKVSLTILSIMTGKMQLEVYLWKREGVGVHEKEWESMSQWVTERGQ